MIHSLVVKGFTYCYVTLIIQFNIIYLYRGKWFCLTQILLIRARVDLGIMAMNVYSTFPKAPELEPHKLTQFSVTSRILVGLGFYSSTELQSAYSLASADWATLLDERREIHVFHISISKKWKAINFVQVLNACRLFSTTIIVMLRAVPRNEMMILRFSDLLNWSLITEFSLVSYPTKSLIYGINIWSQNLLSPSNYFWFSPQLVSHYTLVVIFPYIWGLPLKVRVPYLDFWER